MPHSPGPWLIVDDDGGSPFIYALNESRTINRFSLSTERGYTDNGRTPKDEIADNARLIAAAPELLAAATGLLALMDEAGWNLGDESDRVFTQYEFDAIRAAVRQAKGADQ